MASQTEICNLALTFLGAGSIVSITDNNAKAQALNSTYVAIRDAELRAHTWRFSIKRDALNALVSVPASGPFTKQFQLPTDCLKVLMAGNSWPGADMSDYRTGPSSDDYMVEGDKILSNLPAPLAIRYIYRVTDTGLFDSSFTIAFAAKLAWANCERITQSLDKRKAAAQEYDDAISNAARANVIEKPPERTADDSWILARLQ